MLKDPGYTKTQRVVTAASCSLIMIVASICYSLNPITEDWKHYVATISSGLIGLYGLYGSSRLWKHGEES